MAVTAAQKAQWFESLGLPKSYHYFATVPNLGPGWSWDKALGGSYSQGELDEYLAKTKTAYSSHKTKSKGTAPAQGSPGLDPPGVGAACAKTAVKAVTAVASDVKNLVASSVEHIMPLWNSPKILGIVEQLDSAPSMRAALVQAEKEIAASVGTDAVEWKAAHAQRLQLEALELMQEAIDLTNQLDAGLPPGEYLVGMANVRKSLQLKRFDFDKHTAALTEVSGSKSPAIEGNILLKEWDFEIRTRMDEVILQVMTADVGIPPGHLNAAINNLGSATLGQADELVKEALFTLQTLRDELGFQQTQNLLAVLEDSVVLADVRDAVLGARGQMLVRFKQLQDPDNWLGPDGSLTPDSWIMQYEDFDSFVADINEFEKDLANAADHWGITGAHHIVPASDIDAMEAAFEQAAASAKTQFPAPTPAGSSVAAQAADTPLKESILKAGTDELNPAVKVQLEAHGETPSLVYFMSKEQKQDMLLEGWDAFTEKVYTVKVKGAGGVSLEVKDFGLGTAKAKYAAKNGSDTLKQTAAPPSTSGVDAVTGVAEQVQPNPVSLASMTDSQVASALQANPLPPAGYPDVQAWVHSTGTDPPTPKQLQFMNALLGKSQDPDAIKIAKAVGEMNKAQVSALIDTLKFKPQATGDEMLSALTFKPAPQASIDHVTSLAESVAKHHEMDVDEVESMAEAIDQFGSPQVAQKAPDAVATSKAPPSWELPHTYSYAGDAKETGGWHRKWWYDNEDGNRWLLKRAEPIFRAEGEHAAHRITYMAGLDVSESRVMRQAVGGLQDRGFMQKIFTDVVNDLEGMGINTAEDIAQNLTRQQLDNLQDYQVLDWLMGNMDTHSGNFILLRDGRLVAIDKGQAFKFYGQETLSTTSSVAGNTGHNTYQELWKAYASGRVEMDLDRVDEMLRRVEDMSEEDLIESVRVYAEGRWPLKAGDTFTKIRTADEFYQALLDRKRNIRRDFEEFYGDLAKQRGETWTPKWSAAQKAKLPKDPDAVLTPIDDAFAAGLHQTGSLGKAIYVSGSEVENGQILFDVVHDVSGAEVLRVNLKLRPDADSRLMTIFKKEGLSSTAATSSYAPTPTVPAAVTQAQGWGSAAVDAAKTINHHISLGDFTPNAAKVSAARSAVIEVGAVKTTRFSPTAVARQLEKELAGRPDFRAAVVEALEAKVANAAASVARAEAAKHYAPILEEITAAVNAAGGTGTTKLAHVQVFDVEGAYQKALTRMKKQVMDKLPDVPTAEVVQEPVKMFASNPVAAGYQTSYVRASKTSLDSVVDGTVGASKGWKQVQAVTPDGWKVRYRQIGANDPYHSGWLEIELPGQAQVTAEHVDRVFRWLQDRAGVKTSLARAEDMELTYWRIQLGNLKDSVDAGRAGAVRTAIDAAQTRVRALPATATAADEIAAIREGMRAGFGDIVDRADTLPIHKHLVGRYDNVAGTEFGMGAYERIDSYLYDYEKAFDSHVIVHGVSDVRGQGFTDAYFEGPSGEGVMPREMKQVVGAVVESGYKKEDFSALGSGGSPGWFARAAGTRTGRDAREGYILSPRVMRETGMYTGPNDEFGKMAYRTSKNRLNPEDWLQAAVANNEIVGRSYATFYDDVEVILVKSETARVEMIKRFKDRGVDGWQGGANRMVPIEERVFSLRSGDPIRYYKELRARYGIDLNAPLRRGAVIGKKVSARTVAQQPVASGGRVVSRLAKKKNISGSSLTSKMSVGREMSVSIKGEVGWSSMSVRYHVSENALSVPAEFLTDDAIALQQPGTKLAFAKDPMEFSAFKTTQNQWFGAQNHNAYVIDLADLGVDIKTLHATARRRLISAVLKSLKEGDLSAESLQKIVPGLMA